MAPLDALRYQTNSLVTVRDEDWVKGKVKSTGEMSLMFLSYNFRRAITLKGAPELIKSLA